MTSRTGTPIALRASDLDGDGWPDLLVLEASGTLAVLRNLGG